LAKFADKSFFLESANYGYVVCQREDLEKFFFFRCRVNMRL
jgi:hypothetical protein